MDSFPVDGLSLPHSAPRCKAAHRAAGRRSASRRDAGSRHRRSTRWPGSWCPKFCQRRRPAGRAAAAAWQYPRASRNAAFRQFCMRLGRPKDRGQGFPKAPRAILLDGHPHHAFANGPLMFDNKTFAADLHRADRPRLRLALPGLPRYARSSDSEQGSGAPKPRSGTN